MHFRTSVRLYAWKRSFFTHHNDYYWFLISLHPGFIWPYLPILLLAGYIINNNLIICWCKIKFWIDLLIKCIKRLRLFDILFCVWMVSYFFMLIKISYILWYQRFKITIIFAGNKHKVGLRISAPYTTHTKNICFMKTMLEKGWT